jgi:predicted nucleic-acid-binding protein
MKALDTNALVRFLVRDDEDQAQAVRRIILDAEKKNDILFIPLAVMLETMWVLSSAYAYSREQIVQTLENLLLVSVLDVEEREKIRELCSIASKTDADLADLLIGLTSRDHGCETTLTFDKRAARSGLFTLIK